MNRKPVSQRERAVELLEHQGLVRMREFSAAGITAATIARMQAAGDVERLARGLYQRADRPTDADHELALVAKLVPSGVVCLVSALAYHELTDTIASRVWLAIGSKDRKPAVTRPALQIVRFSPPMMREGVERHVIDGVPVRITSPARTVADLFRYRAPVGRRYRKSPGLALALEGLRAALAARKATPAEIAAAAAAVGVWKAMRPYLESLTARA